MRKVNNFIQQTLDLPQDMALVIQVAPRQSNRYASKSKSGRGVNARGVNVIDLGGGPRY